MATDPLVLCLLLRMRALRLDVAFSDGLLPISFRLRGPEFGLLEGVPECTFWASKPGLPQMVKQFVLDLDCHDGCASPMGG